MPQPRTTPVPADLLARLEQSGRAMSAATVAFHSAVAARQGLSASETKALDALLRLGPLTHAQLVEQTALAPASVTDLIDKIERKGFASRGPHPDDRRRVLVTANQDRVMAAMQPLFVDWVSQLHAIYDDYDDDQLALLAEVFSRLAVAQQGAAERLAAGAESPDA